MVTGLGAWLLLCPSDAAAAEAGPAEYGDLVVAAAGDWQLFMQSMRSAHRPAAVSGGLLFIILHYKNYWFRVYYTTADLRILRPRKIACLLIITDFGLRGVAEVWELIMGRFPMDWWME
jgi:hypothetical protein